MSKVDYIKKYLVMKPEVSKIFDDLEQYLDYCRMNMLPYDPGNVYKDKEWAKQLRKG